jgi:hypothetical protein
MAKRKKVRRVKRVRRVVRHKAASNDRLNILLLALALAIVILAAVTMSKGGI